MPVTVILGMQWGDEGKGKITDLIAGEADMAVRFQGGNNAGHTVMVGKEVFKLRLTPSGVIQGAQGIIGNGCVVDPGILLEELGELESRGLKVSSLRISDQAHVVMPYHLEQDAREEAQKGDLAAGTTKKGIGPAYMDKMARIGLRMGDLLDEDTTRLRLERIVARKTAYLGAIGAAQTPDLDTLLALAAEYRTKLGFRITDTGLLMRTALKDGKHLLLEGAQATHLDIDHGIYPYNTSSNCTIGAAMTGTGLGLLRDATVIGIVKAYTSRVGTGPFPCELDDEIGNHLVEVGGEYGTVTGRRRRCGWLDLVQVRRSIDLNGIDTLCMTKVDILSGLETIKVAIAYRLPDGSETTEWPTQTRLLEEVTPIYEEFPGWSTQEFPAGPWDGTRPDWDQLPAAARTYIISIEKILGVPIRWVGVGKERDAIVTRGKASVLA